MFDYISELGVPDETVSFFLAIFIGTFTISLLIGLALYLLESIGVYKMAKSAEIKNPWLSFVPVGRNWVFGTLAEKRSKICPLRHNSYRTFRNRACVLGSNACFYDNSNKEYFRHGVRRG